MKSNCYPLLIALSLIGVSCNVSGGPNAGNVEILTAASLYPYGRFSLNDSLGVELISSAVHFGFSFAGAECRLFVSLADEGAHNYLQYELDGSYQGRIKVSGRDSLPVIITAPAEGVHTVWIYKATEAHTGPIFIEKIAGNKLESLKVPDAPLIEFIGNSITCGAAADPSEVACGTGEYHDQHNAYMAYGPRVARALGVNFILSSVSGIGVYRNWNSDGPAMPEVYEKVDFQEKSTRIWDFKNYQPDMISIALGTNDFSTGDGKKVRLPFDSGVFVSRYVQFVQVIKSKYPTARIVLLSSPVVDGERNAILQKCITSVKEKIDSIYPEDKPVAVFFFEPMQGRGCTGHPSVEDHAILAESLLPFLKELL